MQRKFRAHGEIGCVFLFLAKVFECGRGGCQPNLDAPPLNRKFASGKHVKPDPLLPLPVRRSVFPPSRLQRREKPQGPNSEGKETFARHPSLGPPSAPTFLNRAVYKTCEKIVHWDFSNLRQYPFENHRPHSSVLRPKLLQMCLQCS